MLQQGTLDRYCTLLTEGMGTAQAAREVGTSTQKIRAIAKRNPDFLANMQESLNIACDKIAHALFKNAEGGSLSAQKFYLTNKRSGEYQEAQNQAPVSTNAQIQVNIGDLARQIALNPQASNLALAATNRAAPRLPMPQKFVPQLPTPPPASSKTL